jgi:hypothetical protein
MFQNHTHQNTHTHLLRFKIVQKACRHDTPTALERGVPLATLQHPALPGWQTHASHFIKLKGGMAGAALIRVPAEHLQHTLWRVARLVQNAEK